MENEVCQSKEYKLRVGLNWGFRLGADTWFVTHFEYFAHFGHSDEETEFSDGRTKVFSQRCNV